MNNERQIGRFTAGGQPVEADFVRLAAEGFAMVINVRDPEDVNPDERAWAEAQGIAFATSFVDSEKPTEDQVRAVHSLLPADRGAKVFIH